MIFLLHRRIVAEYEKTIAQMIGEFNVKYRFSISYKTQGFCHISTHEFCFKPTIFVLLLSAALVYLQTELNVWSYVS